LTPQQQKALDFHADSPPRVIDPRDNTTCVLVRAADYASIREHLEVERRQHGAYKMLHDNLSGRITSDGKGGVALVVDGVALGIEDVASILAAHEGCGFELRIVDSLD
jgi:hypothetical protein